MDIKDVSSTKDCKYCKSSIDKNATTCPFCKKDLKNWFFKHPYLSIILLLIFISMVSNPKNIDNINTNKNLSTNNKNSTSTNSESLSLKKENLNQTNNTNSSTTSKEEITNNKSLPQSQPQNNNQAQITNNKVETPAISTYSKSEYTVYVTKTGQKYHRDGCRYLSKSKIPININDAISENYTACSVCNP